MPVARLSCTTCPLFHTQEMIVSRARKVLLGIVLPVALLAPPAAAENPAVKAMQEYMEFAPYEAGIIVPRQLAKDVFESVVFIDSRDAGQFANGTIPGARNIEWREVLTRIGEIPKDKKVVLFCNTGSLSAQAAFALRVAGRENVLVLQTGIDGWRKDAVYKP
jgi:rhodanese-related sulfurtransferase